MKAYWILSKDDTTLLATAIISYIFNTLSNPWSASTLIHHLLSFSQAERMHMQHNLNS